MPISKKRNWLLAVTSVSVMVPACSSGGEGQPFVGDVATPVDGGEAVGKVASPVDGGDGGRPPVMGVVAQPVDGGDGG